MPGFLLSIDPPLIAIGRKELPLNEGPIQIVGGEGKGIDWGESAIKAFLAEQQFGEVPTDYRVPNRIVTIPLILGANAGCTVAEEEEARLNLQHKVALLQRQGGVLMRQRQGQEEPIYADIVNASLTLPDLWGQSGMEPNVVLKLECLPDFYGEEIALEPVSGSEGQVVAVLKEKGLAKNAVIKGDYPGRCRIIFTDQSGANQRSMLWGLRSTYYASAASAALFFDAATLTPINGATSGTERSAESYSGHTVQLAAPEVNVTHAFIELIREHIASAEKHPSQIGTYRVWARAALFPGQKLGLIWSTDDATSGIVNPAMEATSLSSGAEMKMFDLGEIRLEEPPVGEHWWNGVITVQTGGVSQKVIVDRIWFQPLDDGAGKLRATAVNVSSNIEQIHEPTTGSESNATIQAGVAWANAKSVKAGNASPATCRLLSGETISRALRSDHLGFTLPSTAAIKGIEVLYYISGTVEEGNYWGVQGTGKLCQGTTVLATKAVCWPVNDWIVGIGETGGWLPAAGGPTDLWGKGSWTYAEINELAFGPALICEAVVTGPETTPVGFVQPEVQKVKVNVYFNYGAGGSAEPDAVLYASRISEARFDGCFREDYASTAYTRISEETGDLPRIPPSGMEERPVQLMCKNSRGLLPTPGSIKTGEADPNVDRIQAQVIYRPCYIGRI